MKNLANCLAAALIATAVCASASAKDRFQRISWDGITLRIPATWTVTEKDDHISAENPLGSETLKVTHLAPAAHYLAKKPTPNDILQNQIDHLSPPDTASPETYIVKPYRTFQLPCGEPAAVVIHGLGGDEFSISYSVASTNSLYTVNFYQTGDPMERIGFYQSLIESARTNDFADSGCKAEP